MGETYDMTSPASSLYIEHQSFSILDLPMAYVGNSGGEVEIIPMCQLANREVDQLNLHEVRARVCDNISVLVLYIFNW